MKQIISLFICGIFSFFCSSAGAAAKKKDSKKTCKDVIVNETKSQSAMPPKESEGDSAEKSRFRVIASPRAPLEAKFYQEYVKELTEPGGILDRLGIDMTGQVVEFVVPLLLQGLTSGSSGGYPVRHYLDGASVLESMKPRGGFALEVVYPGPYYQHGFYRDDNGRASQISLIDHVVGHNHFSRHSGLPHYRVGQGLEASRELDTVLKRAYQAYDQDQVMRWYLFVQTLMPLLDYATPLWEDIKSFFPTLETTGWEASLLGTVKRPEIRPHPKRVTENILQAFAANLSPTDPQWKRDILELITVSMSFRPALMHTQIMNEGWASLMQELLPNFSKNNDVVEYWVRASEIMQVENLPKVRDPYSLGVFCWRRLWEVFDQRPDIKALSRREDQVAQFISYATKIIETHSDDEFIRLALDQTFVTRYKLAVVRRATPAERDPSLPPPPPILGSSKLDQWIIVSREPERVAQMIIDTVLRPKFIYRPRVKLMNFVRPNTGEIDLVIDDEVGRALPLDHETLAPALYALANVIGKSISLEATLLKEIPGQLPDWFWRMPQWWRDQNKENYTSVEKHLLRARVTMSPRGDLKTYLIIKENLGDHPLGSGYVRDRLLTEEFSPELTEELASYLRAYINDLYLEDDKTLTSVFNGSETLKKGLMQATAQMAEEGIPQISGASLIGSIPNAPGAISEYRAMLDRRLNAALERAVRLKGGLIVGPKGQMRVRALPSVVHIEFNSDYLQDLLKNLPVSDSVNQLFSAPMPANSAGDQLHKTFAALGGKDLEGDVPMSPFNPDQGGGGQVGPVDGHKGDRFWGPGDNGGGGRGKKASEDPSDPSWIDLPEDLYARFLGEKVKLPKLNKKPGEATTPSTKAGGHIRNASGPYREYHILMNALNRGIEESFREGDEDPFEDIDATFEKGFGLLLPSDIVVKHKRPDTQPDIKAVVTFVMDASGSVDHYLDAFKRFVNDMEILIKANYKGFDFRFIVFDTQPYLLKNRDEFFRFQLGGGTKYQVGVRRALQLFQDEYPRGSWDRYTFLLGDMEDFDDDGFHSIKELLEETEYFGAVAGLHGGGSGEPPLFQQILSEAQGNDSVGHTVIDQDGGYQIKNLKEVLRNNPEE